ncbi:MAG: CARDB domain-containing protein, partial [Bacteroidota bacterium]
MRFKQLLLLILSVLLLAINFHNINAFSDVNTASSLPDLTVSDIFLTDLNQLAIEITNLGDGPLPKKYWDHSQVSIHIYQNGKIWGGISLKICDPSQKLHYPKSKTLYISKSILIKEASQIQVVIDPQDTVRESNEANNSFRKLVACTTPDLAVTDFWVINANRLAIQLTNNGSKRIDLKYWDRIPVYFEIYCNGQSLGKVRLTAIDPQRKLAKPNGKVVYITGSLPLSDSE